VEPNAYVMALTLGASISFQNPYSQRANLLVMAAGGYTARDFFRVGFPLVLIVMATILVVIAFSYEIIKY
jgi:di/tricarboxylate transporter